MAIPTFTSRQLYLLQGTYKSRSVWQQLGYELKPDYHGKPAALVKRKGMTFKVYTQEQVEPRIMTQHIDNVTEEAKGIAGQTASRLQEPPSQRTAHGLHQGPINCIS